MPNLLPDWTLTLPWDLGDWGLRASGRLFWSSFLLIVGIVYVLALMKPPVLKRPFPLWVGIVIYPAIVIGTLLLGALLTDIQRGIVWLGILAILGHTLALIVSRAPRDPEQKATWAECMLGSVGVFSLFTLAYAIIPSEWLTFANADLEWGDSSKFIFKSNQEIFGFLPVNYPFNMDYPALRDIVVTLIYVAVLGLNLKLWVMWQHRNDEPAAAPEGTPEKQSRFGRPLRAWSARRAEGASAPEATVPSAPAPSASTSTAGA
jgi:hypothetical protein